MINRKIKPEFLNRKGLHQMREAYKVLEGVEPIMIFTGVLVKDATVIVDGTEIIESWSERRQISGIKMTVSGIKMTATCEPEIRTLLFDAKGMEFLRPIGEYSIFFCHPVAIVRDRFVGDCKCKLTTCYEDKLYIDEKSCPVHGWADFFEESQS